MDKLPKPFVGSPLTTFKHFPLKTKTSLKFNESFFNKNSSLFYLFMPSCVLLQKHFSQYNIFFMSESKTRLSTESFVLNSTEKRLLNLVLFAYLMQVFTC